MKKIIRLTESDLMRIVKRVLNEEKKMIKKQIKLYSDDGLKNYIGTYDVTHIEGAAGSVYVTLKSTSNSKYPCLKTLKYSNTFLQQTVGSPFTAMPLLKISDSTACNAPKTLYTDNYGEGIIEL